MVSPFVLGRRPPTRPDARRPAARRRHPIRMMPPGCRPAGPAGPSDHPLSMRRWTGSTATIAPVATLANVKAEMMAAGLEEDIPRRRLRPVRWSRATYPLGVAGLAAVYY